MFRYKKWTIAAIIGIVILTSLSFSMKAMPSCPANSTGGTPATFLRASAGVAIAKTQDLQLNTKAGYTIEARFSYDDTENIRVIRESGKGQTQAIDSLVVSFYNPAGEMIASYDNITNGVATGDYFQFNFDVSTQQLLGQIDLGGESAGEMYLKGEVDEELSLIEIDASGEEKAIDIVNSSK